MKKPYRKILVFDWKNRFLIKKLACDLKTESRSKKTFKGQLLLLTNIFILLSKVSLAFWLGPLRPCLFIFQKHLILWTKKFSNQSCHITVYNTQTCFGVKTVLQVKRQFISHDNYSTKLKYGISQGPTPLFLFLQKKPKTDNLPLKLPDLYINETNVKR